MLSHRLLAGQLGGRHWATGTPEQPGAWPSTFQHEAPARWGRAWLWKRM